MRQERLFIQSFILRYPILLPTLMLAGQILLTPHFAAYWVTVVISLTLIILKRSCFPSYPWVWILLIVLVCFVTAFRLATSNKHIENLQRTYGGQRCQLEGVVMNDSLALESSRYHFLVRSHMGIVMLHTDRQAWDGPLPQYGDGIRIMVDLSIPEPARNPGAFDDYRYLTQQGIAFRAYAIRGETGRIFESNQPSLVYHLHQMRRLIAIRLHEALGTDAALPIAMLLADKEVLSDEEETSFRMLGLSHVLVTSGAHVGLLTHFILFLLKGLPLPIVYRRTVLVFILLAYATMTAFTPSISRAALTAIFALFSLLMNRPSTPMYRLLMATFILMLIQPTYALQLGFRLSVFMTAVVLILSPSDTRAETRPRFQTLRLQMAVTLIAFPMHAFLNGRAHILMLLYHVLLTPLLQWINLITLPLAFILCLPFGAVLAFPIIVVIKGLLSLVHLTLQTTQIAPRAAFVLPSYWAILILPIWGYICIRALMKYRFSWHLTNSPITTQRKWSLAGSSVIFLVVLSLFIYRSKPHYPVQLTMLDVGQGDSIHIRTSMRQHWLIDTGPPDTLIRFWDQYRQLKGIPHKVHLILTHLDLDHAGDAKDLIRLGYVARLYLSDQERISELSSSTDEARMAYLNKVQDLMELCEKHKVPVTWLKPQAQLEVGEGKWKVLSYPDSQLDANNASTVLSLHAYSHHILLTGDAEAVRETHWINQDELSPVTILKVGHHGSKHGTTAAFLAATKPQHALISVGQNNRYRHPSSEVLDRLDGVQSHIHRSDQDGAVTFYLRTDAIRIEKSKDDWPSVYGRINPIFMEDLP